MISLNRVRNILRMGRKGQRLIVQFVLFFLLGFALFLGISNYFRNRMDVSREDIASASVKALHSYIGSFIVSANSCKECDTFEVHLDLENSTANYFIEFSLDDEGLGVSTSPKSKVFKSSVHNLNEDYSMSGEAASVKPINLTFDGANIFIGNLN